MTVIQGLIYDAQGRRVGDGPVWSLKDATITRALDGAGSVTVSAPGTEARALDLLTNERRITVTAFQPGAVEGMAQLRDLGSGILRDIEFSGNASSWTITADGPDMLDELKRRSTLLARIYSGATLGRICADLAALAGWRVIVDPDEAQKSVQARFDGVSVLKALQKTAELNGLHLREGAAARTLEVGRFGQDSGLRLVNAVYAMPHIAANDDILLVENLKIKRSSEHVVNWLIPLGGGEGESAITLEHCAQTRPGYPIRTLTVGGKTHYYICDMESIALYGQIEKVGTFKDITPISNSDADLQAAANALYTAAVEWLLRNKSQIDTYRVSLKKVRRTVRPGDTVRLSYKGLVTNDQGLVVNYADVDSDVWVMRATERIGLEGISLDLEITSIDQRVMDAAQIIIGAIESIQMNNLRVQPNAAFAPYVYRREIDATHTAIVPIEISNAVLYLNQCRLFVTSRPFRTTAVSVGSSEVTTSSGGALATSSAAGGDHRHKVASWVRIDDAPGWTGSQLSVYNFAFNASGGSPANLGLPIRGVGSVNLDIYTEGASGNHVHAITIPAHTHTVPALITDFGISDDDQFPSTVRIAVNGIDVTEAVGGPWGTDGSAVDTTLDITAYLVNAAGGLRQRHEVTFSCASGQGEIEVTVELRATIQSIAVS